MTRDEALKLLKRGGAQAVETWNRLRRDGERIPDLHKADLRGASLSEANLSGADLSGVNLNEADLRKANLSGANLGSASLVTANLTGANLRNVKLSGANLVGAYLFGADLRGADLRKAFLLRAHLYKADLSGANLSKGNPFDADFTDASLARADLCKADLRRARLIRTNLDQAVVEEAYVQEVQIEGLTGLPKPPEVLWLDAVGKTVLTGEEARTFFVLPAIVEVYLDRKLVAEERACFQFHEAEVHKRLGDTVYFVGHRYEGQGSVLRFQGPSYAEIYRVLPEFLAPFRMAGAIDWKGTIAGLSETERSEALTVLVKTEAGSTPGRWLFAERMAQVFECYRKARVCRLKEGGGRGLLISIATDPEIEQRLLRAALPDPWDRRQPLQITTGDQADIQVFQGVEIVSKKTETHRYADQSSGPTVSKAFGPHAQAHSTGEVRQLVLSRENGAALTKCFEELKTLVAEVKLPNPEPVAATQGALDEAIAEAQSSKPSGSAITAAWQKAKVWIEGGLGVGLWLATKAEQVRALVEKIQGMLPGGGS